MTLSVEIVAPGMQMAVGELLKLTPSLAGNLIVNKWLTFSGSRAQCAE
jgi:hypothetical protein